MARLPDPQALGQAPAPQVSGPVPTIPNAGIAESASVSAAKEGVGEIAAMMEKAGEGIMQRQEGFARLDAVDKFENEAKARALNIIETGDLSDPMVARKFAADLNALETDFVKNHPGREQSKLQLSGRLQEIRNNTALSIAAKGTEAAVQKVDSTVGKLVNELSMDVHLDPSGWAAANDKIAAMVSEIPMSNDRREAYINEGIARTTSAAVMGMVMSADFGDDQKMQNDVTDILSDPRTARALGETRRNQILTLMQKRADSNKDTEIIKDAKFAFPNDPTKQREFVRDVKLKPSNQINIDTKGEMAAMAETGKADAKTVQDLGEVARGAVRKSAYLDQFESALDTGGFPTGSFEGLRQSLATFAVLMGAPDDVKNIIGSAQTAEAMDSAAKKLSLFEMEKMKGRGLKMEAESIKDAMPGLMKTPEGNKILIAIMRREGERDIAISKLAREIFVESKSLTFSKRDFTKELADLEKQNPVIDEAILSKIRAVSRASPDVGAAVKDAAKAMPAGFEGGIPEGWVYDGFSPTTGEVTLRNKADPKKTRRGPAKDLMGGQQ